MHMSSEPNQSTARDIPFPWFCIECKQKEIYPQETDYTTTIKYDGAEYTIRVPDLAIPTCRHCGEQSFTVGTGDRIADAIREKVGLLTPQEIQAGRNRLEVSQSEMANRLGVDEAMLSRWEEGMVLQPRAMDNLLRVYFESEEARSILRRRSKPEPALI
jgi:putative zinc finger/helix-turn-helix YgiT family protein